MLLHPFRDTTLLGLGIALATSVGAFAYEPPHTQADVALRSGRVAFVGKVLALKLTDRRAPVNTMTALAKLQVQRCLYGHECVPKVLDLSYVVDTEEDLGLGIDFSLGAEYLFVLLHGGNGELRFGGNWKTGIDLAYRLRSPLADAAPDLELSNAWWPSERFQRISRKVIEQLVAERRAYLQQGGDRPK